MALADIKSRDSILKAISEFDTLSREAFLAKYGFGKAQTYFITYEGKSYDSKAIVGAAHGYEFGTPLRADQFSGGERTVKNKLRQLGFSVSSEPIN